MGWGGLEKGRRVPVVLGGLGGSRKGEVRMAGGYRGGAWCVLAGEWCRPGGGYLPGAGRTADWWADGTDMGLLRRMGSQGRGRDVHRRVRCKSGRPCSCRVGDVLRQLDEERTGTWSMALRCQTEAAGRHDTLTSRWRLAWQMHMSVANTLVRRARLALKDGRCRGVHVRWRAAAGQGPYDTWCQGRLGGHVRSECSVRRCWSAT